MFEVWCNAMGSSIHRFCFSLITRSLRETTEYWLLYPYYLSFVSVLTTNCCIVDWLLEQCSLLTILLSISDLLFFLGLGVKNVFLFLSASFCFLHLLWYVETDPPAENSIIVLTQAIHFALVFSSCFLNQSFNNGSSN